MAETIEDVCNNVGETEWSGRNVQRDLVQQGGLRESDLVIKSVNNHGVGGEYNGNPFYTAWARNEFLLVTSERYDSELIDAFARVIGYKPFARYTEPGNKMITTEWDKINPDKRFEELKTKGKFELIRLPS